MDTLTNIAIILSIAALIIFLLMQEYITALWAFNAILWMLMSKR